MIGYTGDLNCGRRLRTSFAGPKREIGVWGWLVRVLCRRGKAKDRHRQPGKDTEPVVLNSDHHCPLDAPRIEKFPNRNPLSLFALRVKSENHGCPNTGRYEKCVEPRSRGLPRSGLGPPLTAGAPRQQRISAPFTGLLAVRLQPRTIPALKRNTEKPRERGSGNLPCPPN